MRTLFGSASAMELAAFVIDFVLHVDKYLEAFVQSYGVWVYALLFLVIFVETGVVVMPFLPGTPAICGGSHVRCRADELPAFSRTLLAAAILGNQSNYTIGRAVSVRASSKWENSRFFNKRAFDQAHAFYERYGGITIVAARFMPFLRTFAPFVAGVAQMTRARFMLYDVLGGARSGWAESSPWAISSATFPG